MKARVLSLASLLTWLALAVCALASTAAWHWSGELASHFPGHLALAGAVLGALQLVLRAWRGALIALLVLAISAWRLAMAPAAGPLAGALGVDRDQNRQQLGLLLWNVSTNNPEPQQALDWIESQQPRPHVIALLETGERMRRAVDAREWSWRTLVSEVREDNFGLMIMVRDVAAEGRLVTHEHNGIASARLTLCPNGEQPIELLVTHPVPPIGDALARDRDRQLAQVAREVALLEPAVIVAGDLNVTPWSPVFAQLVEDAGLFPARPRWPPTQTWAPRPLPLWLGIPIDHVLFRGSLSVLEQHLGPRLGSDHVPVMIRFGLPQRLCEER